MRKSENKRERLSDFELAELFQKRVFLVKINGKLHCFNQKHFQVIDKENLETAVLEVLKSELRHESISRVSAVAKVLRTQAYPDYQDGAFDGWLGFANGILNIYNNAFLEYPLQDGKVYPITYCLNVSYFPHYPGQYAPSTPQLDIFFHRITHGNYALIDRIWEMIGYILTPDTKGKVFFLLQGISNSGKSVLGRFLESFFPQGRVTSLDIYRLGGQYLPEELIDSCLNLSMDLPNKPLSLSAIANLKMMTGDDLSTLEAKYKEAKPFRSHCKMLFSTNHPLKLQEKDTALMNRIICIPFSYTVSQAEQDRNLLSKLLYEQEAAAAKALQYYARLRKKNYTFSGINRNVDMFPPRVDYQLSVQAVMREFINARCAFVPHNKGRTYTEDLHSDFVSFCRENGYRQQLEVSGFSRMFAAMCADKVVEGRWRAQQGKEDKNRRGYLGVILIKKD